MNTRNKRILLTDDDPYWRQRLYETLTSNGYAVTLASDGREAQRILTTETFDILVMDNNMENPDAGLRALEWQWMRGEPTPAILHSSELSYAHEARLRDVDGTYVLKAREYTDDALVQALDKLFN